MVSQVLFTVVVCLIRFWKLTTGLQSSSTHSLSVSVGLSLFVSVGLWNSVSVSLSVSLCLCLSVCVFLSVSLCLCLCLCLCLSSSTCDHLINRACISTVSFANKHWIQPLIFIFIFFLVNRHLSFYVWRYLLSKPQMRWVSIALHTGWVWCRHKYIITDTVRT